MMQQMQQGMRSQQASGASKSESKPSLPEPDAWRQAGRWP